MNLKLRILILLFSITTVVSSQPTDIGKPKSAIFFRLYEDSVEYDIVKDDSIFNFE